MDSFSGYRRPDGRVGIRNHVLVICSVHCVNTVAQQIERAAPGVIAITHEHGCTQLGDDLQRTMDTLVGMGRHPNVYGCLVIGLGCETLAAADLAAAIAASGKPVELISVQDVGGSIKALKVGKKIARRLLRDSRRVQRELCSVNDLIVGLECGGSDAWSGITANPALGQASDLLVAAGGTVILSEVPELIGAEHLLAERGSAPEAMAALQAAIARVEAEARERGLDLRGAQPTPGNMAGGITTLEEKSLGAVLKGGTTPMREFVGYGQTPRRRGLVVMDTPGNDLHSLVGMVAGGAQLVVFTTGRGTPMGNAIAPVIKVASNSATFQRMHDNLDIDAGPILTEGETLQSVGQRIYAEVLAVAGGKLTKAEMLGHREFGISRIGPTL